MNGGWVQLAGPLNRLSDWKTIETTLFGSANQQARYPPTRGAYSAAVALSRMFMLPGATIRGTNALLDADGAAIVIHGSRDNYRTDPTGDSGARIACGVIVLK